MPAQWTNMQIMKCQSDEGTTTAVTKQADGKHLRYILGNGRCVNCNPDGTVKIPKHPRYCVQGWLSELLGGNAPAGMSSGLAVILSDHPAGGLFEPGSLFTDSVGNPVRLSLTASLNDCGAY